MSLWLWVLVGLASAGLLTAIAGLVIALTRFLRLQRRLAELRESEFATKLESLQLQVARLTRISGDAENLRRRAETAVESIRKTPELAGVSEIRDVWRRCAAQIQTIVQELS